MSKRGASTSDKDRIPVFTGNPDHASSFLARIKAAVKAKGNRYKRVLLGRGRFKGVDYVESESDDSEDDEETDNEDDGANMPKLEKDTPATTPMKPKVEGNDPHDAEDEKVPERMKSTIEKTRVKKTSKKTSRETQELHNRCSDAICNLMSSRMSDKVFRRVTNAGVVEGDGPSLFRTIKELYLTGSRVNLLTMLRRLLFIKQDGKLSSLNSHTYEFNALVGIFMDRKLPIPELILNAVHLEGLTNDYAKIRDDIHDEALHKEHTIDEIVERTENYAQRKGLNIDGPVKVKKLVTNASPPVLFTPNGGSSSTKPKMSSNEDSSDRIASKTLQCFNCGKMHLGGEWKCKAPCKICKSTGHTRYHCPKKKKPNGKRRDDAKFAADVFECKEDVQGVLDFGFMTSNVPNKAERKRDHDVHAWCKRNVIDDCVSLVASEDARGITQHHRCFSQCGNVIDDCVSLVASVDARGISQLHLSKKHEDDDLEDDYLELLSAVENHKLKHELHDAKDVALVATDEAMLSKSEEALNTYVDSGAARDYFTADFVKSGIAKVTNVRRDQGNVGTAGKSNLKIIASADVGDLKDVKIVKGIRSNLVSVSKMCRSDDCYLLHGPDDVWKFPQRGFVMPKNAVRIANREGGLYKYDFKQSNDRANDEAMLTDSYPTNTIYKWHQILGHMSPRNMIKGVRDGILKIPEIEKLSPERLRTELKEFPECRACGEALGIKRNRRTKLKRPADDRISGECQADLLWPWLPRSREGYNGAVFLIHSQHRYAFASAIKTKSDAHIAVDRMLDKLNQLSSTNSSKKVQMYVRFDDENVLQTMNMKNVLKKHGCTMEVGAGYHKNSISIVDRVMRSIIDRTRAIMLQSEAPATEWPYALRMATKIYNMSPHTTLSGKSPLMCVTGESQAVDVSNLHTFYAPVYVHQVNGVDRVKSKRTSKIAKLGYYLGTPPGGRGHWIRPASGKAPITRFDVYFREDLHKSLPTLKSSDMSFADYHTKFGYPSPHHGGEGIASNDARNDATNSGHEQDVKESRVNLNVFDTQISCANDRENVVGVNGTTNPPPPAIELRRSGRSRKPRVQHNVGGSQQDIMDDAKLIIERSIEVDTALSCTYDYAMEAIEDLPNPKSYRQAMQAPDADEWEKSLGDEYKNMTDFGVWQEVPRPEGNPTIINTLLVFNRKKDEHGKVCQRKVRLVGDGRRQIYGKDYEESYAPVVESSVMRMMLVLMISMCMILVQFDFSAAFLNGMLRKKIYIRPPPGFRCKPGHLLLLKRALYGTKQAAFLWYKALKSALEELGFVELKSAECLYVRKRGDEIDITFIHVDDGILGVSDKAIADELLEALAKRFKVKSEMLRWYLNINMDTTNGNLHMSIPAYIDRMAKKFRVDGIQRKYATPADPNQKLAKNEGSKHECPYMELVGGLIYAQTVCRPDITQATNRLARHLSNPSKEHWKAAKRVLAYLHQHKDLGLKYMRPANGKPKDIYEFLNNVKLEIYTDSDHAGGRDLSNDAKSTSGFLIYCNGYLIAWSSKKQPVSAQSSCEAEFIAANAGAKKAMHLQKILAEIRFIAVHGRSMKSTDEVKSVPTKLTSADKKDDGLPLLTDSKSVLDVLKRGAISINLRHIAYRYHYLMELVNEGKIIADRVAGEENPADLMTKPVKTHVFNALVHKLVTRK